MRGQPEPTEPGRGVSARTQVAGIVGDPVRHSLSPVMHNAAFAHLDLDWVYVAFPVATSDAEPVLDAAWQMGVAGLSVTMPHKQAAARVAIERDTLVEELGAANTLVRHEGGWVARNTDVSGFRRWVEEDIGLDVARATVGVLGAGGVAGAVVAAVRDAAATVVWNRTRVKAVALAGDACVLDDPAGLADCTVVVSCVPAHAVPPGLQFRAGQLVLDLVYHPAQTALVETARSAGASAHNGLGLLVRQGALQFELWTGREAPLDVMRAAVDRAAG